MSSTLLISIDKETEAAGTVSVFGVEYAVKSPTVKEMQKIMSLQGKLEKIEETGDGDAINVLIQMMAILIPDMKKSVTDELSVASVMKLAKAISEAAFSLPEPKKK